MKPREKAMLFLEPLLTTLAPYGYFRRGTELVSVNRQEKFVIAVFPELSIRGYYKCIWIQLSSFYEHISACKREQHLGVRDAVLVNDNVLGFNSWHFENGEELEEICIRSAAGYAAYFRDKVVPILGTVKDLSSFIAARDALHLLNSPVGELWGNPEQSWAYLAQGNHQAAYAYMDRYINRSWRDYFKQAYMLSDAERQRKIEKAWIETGGTYSVSLYDEIQEQEALVFKKLKAEIQAMDDSELAQHLQRRLAEAEQTLESYYGSRLWKRL